MSETEQAQISGITNVTLYDRSDGTAFGVAKIIGSAEMNNTNTSAENRGGASLLPTDANVMATASTFTFEGRAEQAFLFEKFLGAQLVTTAASATGSTTPLINVKGTSAFDAAAGIASILPLTGSEANIKLSKYVVIAASATTVNVFAYTPVDFASQGTQTSYENDLTLITPSPITVPDATTVDLTDYGLQITGGTTVAFTSGDSLSFTALPPDHVYEELTIGQDGVSFPAFGIYAASRRGPEGATSAFDIPRCVATSGMVIPMNLEGYSTISMVATVLKDVKKGYAWKKITRLPLDC